MDVEHCAKVYMPEPMAKKHPRSYPIVPLPHRELKQTQDENYLGPCVLSQSFVPS